MAESWINKLRREMRETDVAVRAALRIDDVRALRSELERLAQAPHLSSLTWLWGPALYERDRVLFRPFILSNFSRFAMNAKAEGFNPWKDDIGRALESWLDTVDAADDVELTKRLYSWRLDHVPWKSRETIWYADLLRRFRQASTPAERFTVLAKLEPGWMRLDARTAGILFESDRVAARSFILRHLPWFGFGGEKRASWDGLLAASREEDPDFHFELYRRIVDEKRWRADVTALARTVSDPAELDRELERRHRNAALESGAETFIELVRARGRDVVPYILRHAHSAIPRWYQREPKGLPELLAIADERGWLDLWSTLLRVCASTKLFDRAVASLVDNTKLDDSAIRQRLTMIAGPGREANLPGISFAQVHALEDDTALRLYRRFPGMIRGPYRLHVAPTYNEHYKKLVEAAIAARDIDLVDYMASRVAIQHFYASGFEKTVDILTAHYEAQPDAELVSRAADALSRMPAFAVWSYDTLLRQNKLARLLFERSTNLYLENAGAIRDLLESPQIHVQILAFRVLGKEDPRAPAIAAANVDLLQATLFRPLHRRTRLLAFRALELASRNDEATARYLLGRMKEALVLPEKRYPTEQLIGLIARVLHRWPALRAPSEQPRIYGVTPAAGATA